MDARRVEPTTARRSALWRSTPRWGRRGAPGLLGAGLIVVGACGGGGAGEGPPDRSPGPGSGPGPTASGPGPEAAADPAAVARGRRLVDQRGCLSCHTTDGGPSVGPTWKGL